MGKIDDKGAVENWRHVLSTIGAGHGVSSEGIQLAMDQIMSGASRDAQTVTFAFGLLTKRITAAEPDAAAEGMLPFACPVHNSQLAGVIEREAVDIVRTGGDGANTVNISTMSIIVIVASGMPVLEHGNHAASSKSGGADMLKAFGIDIRDSLVTSPEHPDFYVRFSFATRSHPAMRFAGPVRKELAIPTVFNLLGPLTNPARPQTSSIDCAFRDQMETITNTFAHRGRRALVVRGSDGLDEITVTDPTKVSIVENGEVAEDVINPHDYGMGYSEIDALRGDDPTYSADVARRIWAGELEGPIRNAIILNSAAAITISRGLGGRPLEEAMADSIEEVKEMLQSGLYLDILAAAMRG